jgi:hypothetical protein
MARKALEQPINSKKGIAFDIQDPNKDHAGKYMAKVKKLNEMQTQREQQRLENRSRDLKEHLEQEMQEPIKYITKRFEEAKKEHQNGHFFSAVSKLEFACKKIAEEIQFIQDQAITRVPYAYFKLQSEMHTLLAQWKPEANQIEQNILKNNLGAIALADRFLEELNTFQKIDGLENFVKQLQKHTVDFKNGNINLTQYKESCLATINKHQSGFASMHKQYPEIKGLFQRIVEALRSMLRALEEQINKYTGKNFSLFARKTVPTTFGTKVEIFANTLGKFNDPTEPQPAPSMSK